MKGIILYGPPAAGKDTVTRALMDAEPRCEMFTRLKVGSGKTSTYRMTTPEHLADLRARGAIAWENSRYGATYAVDTPELLSVLKRGLPVLHLGQPEAIEAICQSTPDTTWLVVNLWCPRPVAAVRLQSRDPEDVDERLRAWDETRALPFANLTIDTSTVTPSAAAGIILRAVDGAEEAWNPIHPVPSVIVPVLTLKNMDGTLDIAANEAYAQRAAETWLHGFIVSGTIGEGDLETRETQEQLLGIWLERVGPERIYGTAWSLPDCTWISAMGAPVLAVMRNLHSVSAALDFLSAIPAASYIYSHPAYAPTTFTPDLATRATKARIAPAGGKLCKISLADVASIRQAVGSTFTLYDGRCRHIARSMAAGATGVIAAPLSTLPHLPSSPEDATELQQVIDTGQTRMDADLDRRTRLARLTAECRRFLDSGPVLAVRPTRGR